ncbi:MAG: hypothetical protein MIO93_10700, partial [ANME-2 cluster archaeon]|nr:hypothetical protein [ANME-2 cluster archaeon]
FQWIKIGDEINAAFELKDSDMLKEDDYTVFKDEVNVTYLPFSFYENETLKFVIPVSILDNFWENKYTPGNAMFLQLNVNSKVEIKGDGYTLFSSTKKTRMEPVKMTLWTW